jgi:bacteriorhodopsin
LYRAVGHAHYSDTILIVGCDVLMIVTGYVSACMGERFALKAVWFALSSLFYLAMMIALQTNVASGEGIAVRPPEVQRLFSNLKWLTWTVWSFYPLFVGLGRVGVRWLSAPAESMAICVLDLLAKVGMEAFIVSTCSFVDCHDEVHAAYNASRV